MITTWLSRDRRRAWVWRCSRIAKNFWIWKGGIPHGICDETKTCSEEEWHWDAVESDTSKPSDNNIVPHLICDITLGCTVLRRNRRDLQRTPEFYLNFRQRKRTAHRSRTPNQPQASKRSRTCSFYASGGSNNLYC